MTVRLVFLGRLEDVANAAVQELTVSGALNWPELIGHLSPELAKLVGEDRVKIALNGALVADKKSVVLSEGDEVAFLPPVSGG